MIAGPVAWSGTYALPASSDPVAISVQLNGRVATVAFGPGHAGATAATVVVRGTHIRFAFPGMPQDVVFEGSVRKSRIVGTVRQGAVRGAFTLRRGLSRILPLLGVYRAPDGSAVAVNKAEGLAPWLVEIPSGATHGIGASLTVGDRLGDTSGNGSIVVESNGIEWNGTRYTRVVVRQREIRVGASAATLTLPPGAGPFSAVAMVHGSGPQMRGEFQTFASYCALLGIAVLADDKRGIGQSGGTYPGERATDATIDVLAKDAQAEVRFLAGLPQIDPGRVGLLGDSQAGWVIALAASREPAVRWAVPIVGPTVSVDETDAWAELAGKGVSPPGGTEEAMLAQVRAQGAGGFDPRPSLRKVAIPAFWIFGDDDRNVPTKLSVEALQQLRAGHDFTWVVLPMTHTPIELPTGLFASLPRSRGFVSGFFPALGDWLRRHHLGA
jgi:pimeloyl-ACP methyl ester carboxylesterase